MGAAFKHGTVDHCKTGREASIARQVGTFRDDRECSRPGPVVVALQLLDARAAAHPPAPGRLPLALLPQHLQPIRLRLMWRDRRSDEVLARRQFCSDAAWYCWAAARLPTLSCLLMILFPCNLNLFP